MIYMYFVFSTRFIMVKISIRGRIFCTFYQPSQANLSFMVMVSISFFWNFSWNVSNILSYIFLINPKVWTMFRSGNLTKNDICLRKFFGFCRVYTVECLTQFHTFISVDAEICECPVLVCDCFRKISSNGQGNGPQILILKNSLLTMGA